MNKILDKYIPTVENKEIYSYLLFLSVALTYRKMMLLILIPFIFIIKNIKKTDIQRLFYCGGYGCIARILMSLVFEKKSMRDQGLGALIGVNIILFILSEKKSYEIYHEIKQLLLKNKILLILLATIVMGIIWNLFSAGGLKSSIKYFEHMQVWGIVFFSIIYVKESERLNRLFNIGLVLITLNNIMSLLMDSFIVQTHDISQELRINSIDFGVIIFSYFFAKIFLEKKYLNKILNLFFCGVWIYIVIITGGRGSMISMVLTSFVGIIVLCKKKAFLYIPILIGVLIFTFSGNSNLTRRFYQLNNIDLKNNSSYARVELIRAGIYTFKRNVVFGAGQNNTQKFFIEYRDLKIKEEGENSLSEMNKRELTRYPDSHNIIIDYLALYGIFGVIMFIVFFVYIPIHALISYFKNNIKEGVYCFLGYFSAASVGITWSIFSRHKNGLVVLSMLLLFFILRKINTNQNLDSYEIQNN